MEELRKNLKKGSEEKMSDTRPIVVTHNGVFHMDDVFAVATLHLLHDGNITIIRSRDKNVIETGDYVVDTGFVYSPEKKRFDHHQEEGAGKRKNGIPYASFGLVWKEYGQEICDQVVARRVDATLVQVIDAFDNGMKLYKPIYENIHPYILANLTDAFNTTSFENSEENDSNFVEMVNFAVKLLKREIEQAKAFEKEKEIIKKRYKEAKDKRLIIFNEPISWLNAVEILNNIDKQILYIVKPSKQSTKWSSKTILKDRHIPESKKLFPQEWGGKTGEDLQQITGVKDALFCHRVPFICTAESKEGAIALTKLALEN